MTVNLEQLVRELIASVAVRNDGAQYRWKNGHLPIVEGDPSMLKQVFVNLLSMRSNTHGRKDPPKLKLGLCQRNSR